MPWKSLNKMHDRITINIDSIRANEEPAGRLDTKYGRDGINTC